FVTNAANFQSFLFGSIITTTPFEIRLVVILSAVVFGLFLLFYRELFYIAFDEQAARLAGLPVGTINSLFTLLTAITISVAARTVGALIVSSLLVIPAAAAMQLRTSYRRTLFFAVLFSVVTMNVGLFISYLTETQPGGTIVLLQSALLILMMVCRRK
ncbi:MAG: metal ABC transporter permease, partial [Thermoguttaceae bacterium]|nr:metal ABC transporter permease [Thermoguttaceae bacterium]